MRNSQKNITNFYYSISEELISKCKRVRYLVDHWGEDGKHHEAVLMNTIRKFLPKEYEIGTGFIVKQTKIRGEHISSSQIDILIYKNNYPVLFKEGDFVIVTPDSVRAIIEVKANFKNLDINKVINKCCENGKFIIDAISSEIEEKDSMTPEYIEARTKRLFNGLFSFDGYKNTTKIKALILALKNNFETIEDETNHECFYLNHISFNENLFYKFWPYRENSHYLYYVKNLSFSYFISNLMDFLNNDSVIKNSYLWFPEDKEASKHIWIF